MKNLKGIDTVTLISTSSRSTACTDGLFIADKTNKGNGEASLIKTSSIIKTTLNEEKNNDENNAGDAHDAQFKGLIIYSILSTIRSFLLEYFPI